MFLSVFGTCYHRSNLPLPIQYCLRGCFQMKQNAPMTYRNTHEMSHLGFATATAVVGFEWKFGRLLRRSSILRLKPCWFVSIPLFPCR